MRVILARSKVLIPDRIENSKDGETSRDDDKGSMAKAWFLERDVLVLATLQDPLVNRVQAYGVRIRFSGDLVELGGQVVHPADLPPQLVDVTDFAHPPDPELGQPEGKWVGMALGLEAGGRPDAAPPHLLVVLKNNYF